MTLSTTCPNCTGPLVICPGCPEGEMCAWCPVDGYHEVEETPE